MKKKKKLKTVLIASIPIYTTNVLILSVSCSENQQNIIITVTFNVHYIIWQGRKNHYKQEQES